MDELISRYGYAAVFLGTLVEAETMLVLGGLFAHRGVLHLDLVMLCGFAGSWLGDFLIFLVARRQGPALLDRHPKLREAERPVARLKGRWRDGFTIAFRFIYGMRTLGPIALALAHMPVLRFAILGAVGAGSWAVVIATIGYLFGRAVTAFFGEGRAAAMELGVAVILAAISLGAIWLRRRRTRRAKSK